MGEDRKALKEACRARKIVGSIFYRKEMQMGSERDG